MLGAQCDELRALAGDGSMEFVSGPVRASVLRDAADTIWELRDRAQDLQAENAKLRELVRDYDRVLDDCVDVRRIMADVLRYGRKFDALHDRLRELGIEVDA